MMYGSHVFWGFFFIIFTKGDSFSDFLFGLLAGEALPSKMGQLL